MYSHNFAASAGHEWYTRGMTKRLVIIDGMSVFYRGYFAMPSLSLPDGTPTGGVFGFASIAIEVIKKLDPDYVAVAWDKSKTATAKRKELYAEYKAGRTRPPDDFFAQIPLLHDLLESFGWPLLELDGYEADDIIGTVAAAATKKQIDTAIVSGDYDMMQLLSDSTNVYINKKGSDMMRFGEAEFEQKYGIKLKQFIDYKALVGDTSDNIPGVRGIGPKAAETLLGRYGTLDHIYDHIDELKGAQKTNLEQGKDLALLSRQLATIWCDAPIELDWDEADVNRTDLAAVATKLREFEFHSLLRRLPKHMQQATDTPLYFDAADHVRLRAVPWPDTIHLDGPVIVHLDGDDLWVSLTPTTITHAAVADIDTSFWRAIELGTVVGYDIKTLYHELQRRGVSVRFDTVHDVRQAAFLINPLQRDRSLSGLLGSEQATPFEYVTGLRQVYDWQCDAFTHQPKIASVARQLDFPLTSILYAMEARGIKVDSQQLSDMNRELTRELAEIEQKTYSLVGHEFNIGSPAQLSEVLFDTLGLPTTGIKKGKTAYSTGQKELDKLRGQHPIIELIERSRELSKLQNTYVKALPKLADAAGRIHTTFNQDVAATGRLSSTHPNLQNIPVRTELGRRIRQAFVPADGKVFVSADYSQFELRLAAVLAGDTELVKDFNSGVDVHAKTASDVYGVPLADVTKEQRRDAKVINFGVLYGMSPHGLSAATGMNFTQAKQFIDQYFTLRAPIRRFIDATLEHARSDGYVETYYGRRRPTPDIHSSNYMVRTGAERAAANMPIQGTEADLMKRAMIQVEQELAGTAVQLLQIHDSILVECAPQDADDVAAAMKRIMEGVAPELAITLNVDVTTGADWGEL